MHLLLMEATTSPLTFQGGLQAEPGSVYVVCILRQSQGQCIWFVQPLTFMLSQHQQPCTGSRACTVIERS